MITKSRTQVSARAHTHTLQIPKFMWGKHHKATIEFQPRALPTSSLLNPPDPTPRGVRALAHINRGGRIYARLSNPERIL